MLQNNPAGELELALRIRALVDGQDAIVNMARSFLDINRATEQLMLGLKAVNGSLEGAERDFTLLTNVAMESGLSIQTLGDNFLKLTASSKGTILEGERIRTLFGQVSQALMVLGTDTVTTTRAFNAMSQMMSKGQIYSEELKGQLAEAIPGALNIMSRALGITTQQMLQLMESGLLTSNALVAFGYQLSSEFQVAEGSARTFNQVINDVVNQWTLAMKGIGDTGVWTLLKTVIANTAGSMTMLTAAAGAGLTVAITRLGVSMYSLVLSAKDAVTALLLGASAYQTNAVAAFESATANVAAATSAHLNAAAAEAAAIIEVQATRGTILHAGAMRELAFVEQVAIIKTKELAVANAQLEVMQARLLRSQTLWARSLAFAFGPVGTVAIAIGAAIAFAASFGKSSTEAEKAAQKMDAYASSVTTMSNTELILMAKRLDARIEEAEALVKATEYQKKLAEQEVITSRGIFEETGYVNRYQKALEDSVTIELKAVDAKIALDEENRKLALTQAKLFSTLPALIVAEEALTNQSSDLTNKIAERRKEADLLRFQMQKQIGVSGEYQKVETNVIELEKQRSDVDRQLVSTHAERLKIEEFIQKQAEANVILDGQLIKGSDAYKVAVQSEAEEIKKYHQELVRLNEQMAAAAIARRLATANTEAHAVVVKAMADALRIEGKLTADGIRQREIAVQLAKLELDGAREQLALNEVERADIEIQLRLKAEQLALGSAKDKQTKEEIGALEILLIKKRAEITGREQNIESLKLEARNQELAAKGMTKAMAENRDAILDLRGALAFAIKDYEDAVAAGQSMNQLEPIVRNIARLQGELAEKTKETAIIMKQGWKAVGQDAEEAATGMDFQTRAMIDAFERLGASGEMSAKQLNDAFTNALNAADTKEELDALAKAARKIGESGVWSRDQVKQALDDIALKSVELEGKIKPLDKAMKEMGLGVPAQMEAMIAKMRTQVDLLDKQTVGVERSDQAWLKYAEANIIAANAGANVNLEAIRAEAASRGLGAAFSELEQKSRKMQPALQGVADVTARMAALANDYTGALESEQKAVRDAIQASIDYETTMGNTSKANSLKIELLKTEIEQTKELAKQKKVEIDAEIAAEKASAAVLQAITNKTAAEEAAIVVSEKKVKALEANKIAIDKEATATEEALKGQLKAIKDSEIAAAAANHAEQIKKMGELTSSVLTGWAMRLQELSPAARTAFDGFVQGTNLATGSLQDMNAQIDKNMDLQGEIASAMTGGIIGWMNSVAAKAIEIEQAFLSQRIAILGATDTLDEYAKTGELTATVQQAMNRAASDLGQGLHLVGDEDLSGLRRALDSANDKLNEMKGITQDASDRLAELNAELLEAQGADDKAAILRQQLDYQQQLADIETQRAVAEAAGNRELLSILDRQREVLERINEAKLAGIATDAQTSDKATRGATTIRDAWSGAADQVERTGKAISNVGSVDLSRLNSQVEGLAATTMKLNQNL